MLTKQEAIILMTVAGNGSLDLMRFMTAEQTDRFLKTLKYMRAQTREIQHDEPSKLTPGPETIERLVSGMEKLMGFVHTTELS